MQVKDEVNAGNLLYKKGKIEFKNVYFSYTNGLVQPLDLWFGLKFFSPFKILLKHFLGGFYQERDPQRRLLYRPAWTDSRPGKCKTSNTQSNKSIF